MRINSINNSQSTFGIIKVPNKNVRRTMLNYIKMTQEGEKKDKLFDEYVSLVDEQEKNEDIVVRISRTPDMHRKRTMYPLHITVSDVKTKELLHERFVGDFEGIVNTLRKANKF